MQACLPAATVRNVAVQIVYAYKVQLLQAVAKSWMLNGLLLPLMLLVPEDTRSQQGTALTHLAQACLCAAGC